MNCKVCGNLSKLIFSGHLLQYDVQYFYCNFCGFLFTEEPYWLEDAYKEPINSTDTGILYRNIALSKITSVVIFFLFNRYGKFLDYAGGYGIFVRLMRDLGFDFCWYDKFSSNLFAHSFDCNINQATDIELVACFEAFEHFVNPIEEIKTLLKLSDNILFSTRLLPKPPPKPEEWWYYGLDHGQHISFFSVKTLKYIANKFNLNFYSNGRSTHLFTIKNVNPILAKFILIGDKVGLFPFVKARMQSMTWKDYESMKK